MAHKGVLFLDELTEFPKTILEQLREPLETGEINIARAAQYITFPADFMLVAACNPCACSYLGDGTDRCNCSRSSIEKYRNKLSGPLLDRIDIHVYLFRVPAELLREKSSSGETSETVQKRVNNVVGLQQKRQGCLNNALTGKQLDEMCELDKESLKLLEQASQNLHLSARAYHRILKIARTLADMEGLENIQKQHIAESIGYRVMDRRCAS